MKRKRMKMAMGTYFSEDMYESSHQGSGGSSGRGGDLMRP
jgi:hypothetical protein